VIGVGTTRKRENAKIEKMRCGRDAPENAKTRKINTNAATVSSENAKIRKREGKNYNDKDYRQKSEKAKMRKVQTGTANLKPRKLEKTISVKNERKPENSKSERTKNLKNWRKAENSKICKDEKREK
jgi:hypothetical protein